MRSEGILANACRFIKKDGHGIVRTLHPSESLHSIFGAEDLVTMEVMFETQHYEWNQDQHLWYESNAIYRSTTLENAIKALESKTITQRHERSFNKELRKWVFDWEPKLIRDYPGWRPIIECDQCREWLSGIIYCFNCSMGMCPQCCSLSGWPAEYSNVLCEGCTDVVFEALTE